VGKRFQEVPMQAFTALLGCAIAVSGCADAGVGRKCSPPSGWAQTNGDVMLVDPAPECPSRQCLVHAYLDGSPPRGACTIPCTSDDDCAAAIIGSPSEGLCGTRFVCTTPIVTGDPAVRCKKFCSCADDLGAEPDPGSSLCAGR
jgi:hypothetical protein